MAGKKSNNHITIHNKISPSYREIHVDGAYGGVTPKGQLALSFYAERFPIPKSSDFEIDLTGSKMTKIADSDDSKKGVLREYEFGVYMTYESAKALLDFMQKKISELEEIQKNNK